jgi:regulator of replication initiation timing
MRNCFALKKRWSKWSEMTYLERLQKRLDDKSNELAKLNQQNSDLVSENDTLAKDSSKLKDENDDLKRRADQDDRDRDRFVSLAQLYQDSWNRLREYEWRLQITIWATFLTFVGILACGGIKAFGIEIATPKSISGWWTQFWITVSLIAVTILMTIGSYGLQKAFRYFERLRDYYVEMSTGTKNNNRYDWDTPTPFWGIPWDDWNSRVCVAATAIITGFLALLTFLLLPSQAVSERLKTIKGTVQMLETEENGRDVRIHLNEKIDILAVAKEPHVVLNGVSAGDKIEAIVLSESGKNELQEANITKVETGTITSIKLGLPQFEIKAK